ncbi:MAG: AI-2E family transporter [Planctomycetes bacterium]|nr:AI-2E family transporter [Planctomycetota bacterium]
MIENNKPFTFDRVIRIAISFAIIWAVISSFQYLSDVLIPFGAAFLLAYLVNPLVCLVQRKVPHRVAAVVLTVCVLSVIVSVTGYVCIVMVMNECLHFADLLKALAKDGWSEQVLSIVPPQLAEEVRQTLTADWFRSVLTSDGAWTFVKDASVKVLPWLQGVGLSVMSLLGLSVVILYMVFLLVDYQWFIDNWNKIIPPKNRDAVQDFLKDFDAAMNRHFRAQALISAITAVLFIIGFLLIGLPMAILFGIFVGVLNMVPYLQIIALVPAALLALIQALEGGGGVLTNMILVLGVFGVVQLIQDALIVPPIMGKAFGLRPVIILLAIMVWGKLLGLLGLIIALPLTCLAWAWYHRLVILPQESEISNVDSTQPSAD